MLSSSHLQLPAQSHRARLEAAPSALDHNRFFSSLDNSHHRHAQFAPGFIQPGSPAALLNRKSCAMIYDVMFGSLAGGEICKSKAFPEFLGDSLVSPQAASVSRKISPSSVNPAGCVKLLGQLRQVGGGSEGGGSPAAFASGLLCGEEARISRPGDAVAACRRAATTGSARACR